MSEQNGKTSKAKEIMSKVISVISTIILLLAVVAAAFSMFSKSNNKLTYIGKYAVVRILTESMRPEIEPGDYILIEKTDPKTLCEGDVITFVSTDPSIYGSLNTHRIVSINGTTITTKGDYNVFADTAPVEFSSVQGKYVCSLDFFTAVGNIFSQPIGYVVFIAVPMLFILSSYMRDLMKEIKTEGNGNEQPLSEEEQIKKMLDELRDSGELNALLERSSKEKEDKVESETDIPIHKE